MNGSTAKKDRKPPRALSEMTDGVLLIRQCQKVLSGEGAGHAAGILKEGKKKANLAAQHQDGDKGTGAQLPSARSHKGPGAVVGSPGCGEEPGGPNLAAGWGPQRLI